MAKIHVLEQSIADPGVCITRKIELGGLDAAVQSGTLSAMPNTKSLFISILISHIYNCENLKE